MAFNWSDPFGLGGNSPYGSPLPGAGGNPYNPAAAFQYDPATLRRAAISNALLSAGAAMLGQGPSRTPINFGTSLGQGVAAGLQGADTGVQQAMQRQQFAQQTAAGGQQYQQGKIGLAGAYGDLAFQAYRLSRILGRNVTPQELLAHPELAQSTFGATQGQPGPAAPAPSALDPTAQGGQPESTWQSQSGGDQGAGTGGAPLAPQTPEPAAGSLDAQLAAYDQAINDDLVFNGGKGVAGLEKARADLVGAPRQAADVASATELAQAGGPQARVANVKSLSSDFISAPPVKTLASVQPYIAPLLSAAKGDTGVGELDLINSAIKVWNPDANIRPGTIASVEDVKGVPATLKKAWVTVAGGGVLPQNEKDALVKSSLSHYAAYAAGYGTARDSFLTRAKGLPGTPITEQEFNPLAPAAGAAPTVGTVQKGTDGKYYFFTGGDPKSPDAWQAAQ